MRDDDINLKMKVDPNLKDDTVLQMGNNQVTYGELKDMYKVINQEPIRCLIYWDDVCQYTSLGLIEVINALFKTDAKIDFEHFFTRPNDYIYGIEYVYKIFENVLKPQEIDKIKRKYYWKIMEISLKSMVFNSSVRINNFYERIGFYFSYHFKNSDMLRAGFKETIFTKIPLENIRFYYGETDGGFNDILKKDSYNSIITPNIKGTYEYIINNDLKKIAIIGPEDHNGMTEEIYEVLEKYKKLPLPNYCSLNVYSEQIYK